MFFQKKIILQSSFRFTVTLRFCKEIQPVLSEGDQPWDFFGTNGAKAEMPVLWPPDAKNRLSGKDPATGKD